MNRSTSSAGSNPVNATTIAASANSLNHLDTLVLADIVVPAEGSYDPAAFYANLKSWVESGGNLVLTDRSLHVLEGIGFVPAESVTDIKVYQPYANIADPDHPMVEGLRGNARQLAEATLVGYPIGNNASPMSVVTRAAWEAAGGHTVGTTRQQRRDLRRRHADVCRRGSARQRHHPDPRWRAPHADRRRSTTVTG